MRFYAPRREVVTFPLPLTLDFTPGCRIAPVQNEFRIGEVSERSGVSIDTVRYYERRHLLPQARRSAGGYRIFTEESIKRVLFIKQAQELGFSLEEIGVLLTDRGCVRVRDLLDVKVAELDARVKSLQSFREKLSQYLVECEAELKEHPGSTDCPVLDEIAHLN
jgi:DNA-binding transcriptional MerR regulator